jgi:hypothetical protein
MSGCSLPGNCRAEGVIARYFPVENQMNPFAPSFGIHGDTSAVQEVFAFVRIIGNPVSNKCAGIGTPCEAVG